MTKSKKIFLILLVLVVPFLNRVCAHPSGGRFPPTFEKRQGFWYDSWSINRNSYSGEDGYLPNMFYETVGNYSDLAYSWGLEFKQRYVNRVERAEAILHFVQLWTLYGYDEEYVFMDGEPQLEWAWNGDEMAYMVQEAMDTTSVVRADCEDVSFFCATMYYAADFDVAIVDALNHCALLIWFPDYPNANIYWKIHDGREFGWIWIEATGNQNAVGWTPPSFSDGDFKAFPVTTIDETFQIEDVTYVPLDPSPGETVTVTTRVLAQTSQIRNVTLIFSVDGEGQHQVNMTREDTSLYEGSIPGQEGGSEIEFYIQIEGVRGETVNSSSFMYEVRETIFGVEPVLFYLVTGIVLAIVLLSILS